VSEKGTYQLKSLRFTQATEAWIESELAKNPTLTVHEVVRNAMHQLALGEIRRATVLTGIAARRGIRGDGEGG
jgi:hypothetical protein